VSSLISSKLSLANMSNQTDDSYTLWDLWIDVRLV
jgi:hypothetical protein